jgi:hypothetical protein
MQPTQPSLRSAPLFGATSKAAPHLVSCDCVERGGGLRFKREHEGEHVGADDVTVDAYGLDDLRGSPRDGQPGRGGAQWSLGGEDWARPR